MKNKILSQFTKNYYSKDYAKASNIALFLYRKNPYNTFVYHLLFGGMYKQKRYKKLTNILYQAHFLMPNVIYIKELLFFMLSHHYYKSKITKEFILDFIVPKIKEKKVTPFMLYCFSKYNAKNGFLESALFYSSLIFRLNNTYSFNPLWVGEHLNLLNKTHNTLLIKEFLTTYNFNPQIMQNRIFLEYYNTFVYDFIVLKKGRKGFISNINKIFYWVYTKEYFSIKNVTKYKVNQKKNRLKWILLTIGVGALILFYILSLTLR